MNLKLTTRPVRFYGASYIETEKVYLFFICSALVNAMLLRVFTVGNLLSLKPILADLAFLLIVSSISCFMDKKKGIFLMALSILFSAIFVIDAMYYHYYSSFTSVSLFQTSRQLGDVQDAILKNVLHPYQFAFFWQPVAFWYYYKKQKGKNTEDAKNLTHDENLTGGNNPVNDRRNDRSRQKRYAGNAILVGLAALALFIACLTPADYSRFRSQWYREYIVMQFGAHLYHMNDIIQTVTPEIYAITGFDEAKERFDTFYRDRQNQDQNQVQTDASQMYKGLFEGKDVYVIHGESLQSFLMTLSFRGQEVTPNLNRLAKEGMFFSDFYAQTSIGTSSDTEFTFNTSLMPASVGTVFINHFGKKFVAMPELLKEKGYYPFSMHANSGSFWNREVMHQAMGYEQMIDKAHYLIDEEIGLGLSDVSFFRQSVPMIQEIKERENKPLYATLIMLTNHTPFADTGKLPAFPVDCEYQENGQSQTSPYMEGTKMGNYIKTAHYADMAIGYFLEDMEARGLLDNAVVVIYGDHHAKLPAEDFNRLYNYDPATDSVKDASEPNTTLVDGFQYELDKKVPFIIWTKDQEFNLTVDKAMGMLDVLPTLGNMLGISSPYQLGQDIFSDRAAFVPLADGSFLTDEVCYDSQLRAYRQMQGESISDYYIEWYGGRADQLIKLSNDIMKYDLIRKSENPD